MSLVSNGSLNENTTPYIGIFPRSGLRPNCASSSAARSSASGSWRKFSHIGGAPGGSGPSEGCLSNSPRQVTERSPRMFSVPIALTCPALGMPTIIPNCWCTFGSDAVASMRPYSIGGPWYLSRSGRIAEAFTVWVGKRSGAPARTASLCPQQPAAPSSVTSMLATPLKARTRSMYRFTTSTRWSRPPGSRGADRRWSPLQGGILPHAARVVHRRLPFWNYLG